MKQSQNIFDESLLVTCLVVYYWHGCDKICKRDSDFFFKKLKLSLSSSIIGPDDDHAKLKRHSSKFVSRCGKCRKERFFSIKNCDCRHADTSVKSVVKKYVHLPLQTIPCCLSSEKILFCFYSFKMSSSSFEVDENHMVDIVSPSGAQSPLAANVVVRQKTK